MDPANSHQAGSHEASSPDARRHSPIYMNDVNRHLTRLRVTLEDPTPQGVKESLLEVHEALASLLHLVAEIPGRPELTLRPQPLPAATTEAT